MDDQFIEFDVSCSPLDISEEVNIYGHIRSVSADNNSAEHHFVDYDNISKEVRDTAASEYPIVQTEESDSSNLKPCSVQREHAMSASPITLSIVGDGELEFSSQSLCLRNRCMRGDRDETKNIIKHLSSEIMVRIRLLATVQQLTPEELRAVDSFKSGNLGLANLSALFTNQEFAGKFREFFDSSNFLQRILKSQKSVRTKVILIKYLEKMRKVTCGRADKWKQ